MLKTYTLAIAAIVATAGSALAQVDEAAKQKLQQMADTIQGARSLSYRVDFSGAGGFFAMLPAVKCETTLKRHAERPGVWLSRVEGRREATEAAGGAPAVEILIVSDGTNKTWVDAPNKKIIERPEGQAGNADVILAASMGNIREIPEATAMTKELDAPSIKAEAAETVAGVQCDVIMVDQGTSQYSTRWSIGKDDHLPRKVTRAYPGVGTQVWNISSIKLNPDVPDTAFKITTPDGYTFEPAIRPPQPAVPLVPTTQTQPPGQHERAVGANLDDLAPDFELTSLKGEKVKLSDLRGNVVAVTFWGTWCLSCKKVGPELQRLSDAYKDKPVKVLALTMRESTDEKPADYMKDNNFSFNVLVKADDVAKTYKVKAPPQYFVIGKEGQIVHVGTGYEDGKTFPAIIQAIEQALSGTPATQSKTPTPKPSGPSNDRPADDK